MTGNYYKTGEMLAEDFNKLSESEQDKFMAKIGVRWV